jgi:hypothetical protein
VGARSVKKTNYLVTPLERVLGRSIQIAISAAPRRVLVAFGGVAVALGLLLAVEALRLADIERIGTAYENRVTAIAARVERAKAVQRDVEHLRAFDARISSMRRSGDMSANEFAMFGNALPVDVWLTAVHSEGRALALDGEGRTLTSIASAVAALERLPQYAAARLVSLHTQGPGSVEMSYTIVLEHRR